MIPDDLIQSVEQNMSPSALTHDVSMAEAHENIDIINQRHAYQVLIRFVDCTILVVTVTSRHEIIQIKTSYAYVML